MKRMFILLMLAASMLVPAAGNAASGQASKLFSNLKRQVYQIRVIDLASGDQFSLGSGFQIDRHGLAVTNFHVVSPFVHKPGNYKLEYVYHDGSTGSIELIAIDVIHDLAIIKLDTTETGYFRLNNSKLQKGERIYSMGNPQDLGMTIIEGIYNGFVKTSRYKKILFSGSLNPGMSGGPAIDENGRIIGINVAKGSEQLSFLVPVENLVKMINDLKTSKPARDFEQVIKDSLFEDQEDFYSNLLAKDWVVEPFMELSLPGEITDSIKCWGQTDDKKENLYNAVHEYCYSQDQLYISQDLFTGTLFYEYEWLDSTKMNRFQFYNLMEREYDNDGHNNASEEDDITNYDCSTDFIDIGGRAWKSTSCIRAYKNYRGLYDMLLLLASTDRNHKGLILKAGATGVSKKNALLLIKKFTGSATWTH